MMYSMFGIVAFFVLIIENNDILFTRRSTFQIPLWKAYRRFLYSVLIYYTSDILWGLLEAEKLSTMLFIDTTIYYVSMSIVISCWTRYVVVHLDEDNMFGRFLLIAGRVLSFLVLVLTVVNVFTPLLFSVDEACVYHPLATRYAVLALQILLLLLVSAYALSAIIHKEQMEKGKYRTLSLFGFIVAVFLTIQMWFPYLPLYTISFMLGISTLHAFVIIDEMDAHARLEKEYESRIALVQKKASIDALTGVKNRFAYLGAAEKLERQIAEKEHCGFAFVIFDVNNLKTVNDTKGHQAGDQYIRSACKIICDIFKHSPVYRVGGDEFVVIAEAEDYDHLDELVGKMRDRNREAARTGGIVIACGVAKYENDTCVEDVFERADADMFNNKYSLKSPNDRR